MRDKYGVDGDPDCWPGTDVLKNSLGIRDGNALADAEAEFAAVALGDIEITAPPFDLDYLCKLHRQLFGDIYNWAGQIRNVDISKGHTRFCTARRIAPEANRLLQDLGERDLSDLPRASMLRHVAECYGELNLIHPFREGNGRTQRLFFEHWLLLSGYTVDWSLIERDQWIPACVAAVSCDYAPLEKIFDKCTTRLEASDDA